MAKKNMKEKKPPMILIIMDGWGLAPASRGNAVTLGRTPNLDAFEKTFPSTTLEASGKAAGLPPRQDGNSEAGHMNIGAGRIVEQDVVMISKTINDGTFFKNTAFLSAIRHVKKYKSKFHLMGLLTTDQSAHAYPDHIYALLELLRQKNVKEVYFHLFTDGRDSSQYAARKLLKKFKKIFRNGEIVQTIIGRFYAMDRKKYWPRTEMAYNAMVMGEGLEAKDPNEAVEKAYKRGETDEFIKPTVIKDKGKTPGLIDHNDSVIFFNLRSDRAREITKAFIQHDFNRMNPASFKRKKFIKNLLLVAMTDFGPDLPGVMTAYPSKDLTGTLTMALAGHRQLYISENEKYAHVTYFFNGGYADPVAGEKRIMVPSPDVPSYDQKPEMGAYPVTKKVIAGINKGAYDFICVNFANPDMVGHTGNLGAGIKAVEVVDECVGKIVQATKMKEGTVLITADHGNVEEMIDLKTGEVDTKHSTYPVPFIVVNDKIKKSRLKKGVLADIATTILTLLDLKLPGEMTGKNLLKIKK